MQLGRLRHSFFHETRYGSPGLLFEKTFELLFDGQIVDSVSFLADTVTLPGELAFDSLSASLLDIAPGSHEIRIRVSGSPLCDPGTGISCDCFTECGRGGSCEPLPDQFLDNVTLVLSPSILDATIDSCIYC